MLKQLIRKLAHRMLGFDNYLFLFSWISGLRMRFTGTEKEFRYFVGLLPESGAILDIGANIGIMSVALAKRRPNSLIYAFEPMPANLKALKRILRYYGLKQVQVMPWALGNQNGLVEMLMPVVDQTMMQGYSHVIEPQHAAQPGARCTVPMHRLDDIAELKEINHISAIKIDVENHEYFVLKGGECLIRQHQPVIYCELWNDQRRVDCIRLLEGLGYRTMVYQQDVLVDFADQPVVNFFFIPKDRKAAAV
jgi:FkbM family methyltransferase